MAGHRPLDVAQGMMKVMGDDRELQVMKAWGQSEASSAHPCFAAHTDKLERLAQDINLTPPENPTVKAPDVTWGDVLGYIETAKKSYAKKGDDDRFRGWIRDGDNAVGVLERLTELIPDQVSNVTRILQELDEVPSVLASIFKICRVYSTDVQLKNLVWDFYETLMDCLPELVTILNRTHKDTNVLKRLAKQLSNVEAAKVGDICERIGKAKQTVFDATVHLDRNTWQQTRVEGKETRLIVEATRKTAHDISTSIVEFREESSDQHGRLERKIDEFRSEIRSEFHAALSRCEAFTPASMMEAAQGAFYQLFTE
ncbi:hypothetical protein CPLU01_15888, partial [Colletotrichum plurivorum]